MTVQAFLDQMPEEANGGRIYHAVQLRDFRHYVALGCIASRKELFEAGRDSYTPFDSDGDDVNKMNCAADVFANLHDQGRYSAKRASIPNVYGPITLVFSGHALANSNAVGVNVRKGAIWSNDVDSRRPLEVSEVPQLYKANGWADQGELQLVGGTLHLEDLIFVLVNPVRIGGQDLLKHVCDIAGSIAATSGFSRSKVLARKFESADLEQTYERLVTWAALLQDHHGNADTLPPDLQAWFHKQRSSAKRENLRRFAEYLWAGTISAMPE